jgi:hypothetical protein
MILLNLIKSSLEDGYLSIILFISGLHNTTRTLTTCTHTHLYLYEHTECKSYSYEHL